MSGTRRRPSPAPGPELDSDDTGPRPDGQREALLAAAKRLYRESRQTLRAARRAWRSLHQLLARELALARVALLRAVVFATIALVLAYSAWMYLLALLVTWLQRWLGWPGALALAAALTGVVAVVCAWRVVVMLRLLGFEATRRQLLRTRHVLAGQRQAPPTGPDAARPEAESIR